jgi:hypothetical protein
MENIYENIDHQISSGVIYTEVLRKEKPMARTVIPEHSIPPSNENEQESTRISVRDLVKKFNRQ